MCRVKKRMTILLLLGVIGNLWVGYTISLLAYIQAYGGQGLEQFKGFISQPGRALSVLLLGDETAVGQRIHDLFLGGWQWVYWGVIALLLVKIIRLPRRKYKEAADWGSHGTARWATDEEIRELQKDPKGFLLGEYKGKPVVHPMDNPLRLNSNFLIFGGSGSAKTAGFGIPGALHIGETLGHSMILTDPKGELYNKTSRHFRDLGYRVIAFNLLDENKRRSARYNPMGNLKRDGRVMTDEVVELADQLIEATGGKGGDQFFTNSARDLLIALMLYLLEVRPPEEQHLRNVLYLAGTIGKDQQALRSLFEELPVTSEARAFFDNVDSDAEKQWEGIRGELRSRLGLWNLQSIAELTAASDFEFSQMGREKTVLYLMTPDSNRTYDLIPTLMIDQAFKELIRLADASPGGRLPVPVWFILDELGNIAPIKDLDARTNTIRSRGIQLVAIFQSIPQFEDKYGRLRAKSIDSSCDTTIFLGTKNDDTNERVSKSLGTTTIKDMSVSENRGSKSESAGISESYTGRPLLYPDEVRDIRNTDELIVIQTGRPPMRLKKHMYFKQEKWRDVVAKETHWTQIPEREYQPLTLFKPSEPLKPSVPEKTIELTKDFFERGA